jgi:hypothetical protein
VFATLKRLLRRVLGLPPAAVAPVAELPAAQVTDTGPYRTLAVIAPAHPLETLPSASGIAVGAMLDALRALETHGILVRCTSCRVELARLPAGTRRGVESTAWSGQDGASTPATSDNLALFCAKCSSGHPRRPRPPATPMPGPGRLGLT